MTIELNENLQNAYVANGSTNQFEIRFKWYEEDEVQVSTNGTIITSGYSVVVDSDSEPDSANDSDVVAYVVFDSNPSSSTIVLLEQALNVSQETEYNAFGSFKAKSHEYALDKLTLLIRSLFSVFDGLESRVSTNEDAISQLGNGIINIDNDISALQTADSNLQDNIDTVSLSVTQNSQTLTSQASAISAVEADVITNSQNALLAIDAINSINARVKKTATNLASSPYDQFENISSTANSWAGDFPTSTKTLETDLAKLGIMYNGYRIANGYSISGRRLQLNFGVNGTDQLVTDYEEY